MEINDLPGALESILFASGSPISTERIAEALELSGEVVEAALSELADRYSFERRGIRIVHLENEWQMTTSGEFAPQVRRALELRKPPPLSKAALEVLSIIAYYQPVTRAYIEQIRGVDSSNTVGMLAERGLIEDCGFLDLPGRPRTFRTTPAFLRTFGLESINELPSVADAPNFSAPEGQITFDSGDLGTVDTITGSNEEE